MAEQPSAVDQSWAFLDPTYAAQHGIRVVCDYLSHDPSKDWTAAQIKAYHAAGVGVVFLWETTANRALSGYSGGLADGRSAGDELDSLISQVGYAPANPVVVIAAIDFDTNPSQYPVIGQYITGIKAGLAARYLTGAYGEADVLDALGAALDVGFQTYAWSGGRVSARADLYQYLNGQTLDGAEVDFDRIIDDSAIGAWWPAGHSPSSSGTPITEDDMGSIDDTPENEALVKQWTAEATFGPAGSGADLSIDVPGVTAATSIVQYLVDTRGALGTGLQSTYDKLSAQISALSDKVDGLQAGGAPAAPMSLKVTLEGTAVPE